MTWFTEGLGRSVLEEAKALLHEPGTLAPARASAA
jgi:hypothetical protein